MKESRDIKAEIIDVSWRLFHEKGYENTTVDILDATYEELEKSLSDRMGCFDKLMLLNYEVHKMIEEKISFKLLASMYAEQLQGKGYQHLSDRNRTYFRLISRIVEEGQKRGEINTDKTIEEIVDAYVLCERAVVTDWCLKEARYSLSEYSRKLMPELLSFIRKQS